MSCPFAQGGGWNLDITGCMVKGMGLLPWWLSGKESTCNVGAAGDAGSISGSGRSPGEENSYPLQYPCLENSTDRGACWATVHGGLLRVGYD